MPLPTYATPEIIAAVIFGIAVIHTFSTKFFAHLAQQYPTHAGLWHLLGEVEVVFGLWAFVMLIALFFLTGHDATITYLEARNFTEPMFVFVIMVIAASKPILNSVIAAVHLLASFIPIRREVAVYFLCLSAVPLLGSLVTEPAAMTLAALMLKDCYFRRHLSTNLKYATLGALFVNVSIGGTLTSFAAPPVLMVAKKWGWDSAMVFTNFGWKAALSVCLTALIVTWLFRRELVGKGCFDGACSQIDTPKTVAGIHILFLVGVVVFAHHAELFMGLFLFFLGYTEAYKQYQDRLILREGLLVAFFLAGLVVLGGMQGWWLQNVLNGVEPKLLYYLATALTAITDNAALTYLASLVEGVSDDYKYAIVAGAVTGGGLTIIANAPNPAGVAILKCHFTDDTISPLALFIAAMPPTLLAIFAFQVL
jgi:Putative Na+/H+ antiporter